MLTRSPSHRGGRDAATLRAARGLTLIEIMITLAIIGLVMIVGYMGLRTVTKSTLRGDTAKVAAALRNAYNMAAQTGKHYRVVFDLKQQTFRIQVCEGNAKLHRSDKEKAVPDENAMRRLKEVRRQNAMLSAINQAKTPEQATEMAAALAGVNLGGARCGPPKFPNGKPDPRGRPLRMRTKQHIAIQRILVQHLKDPQTDGIVSVNFFPLGYAEKAVIEVGDEDGDSYSVLVYGLTGRVDIKTGQLDDPNAFMMRGEEGNHVGQP